MRSFLPFLVVFALGGPVRAQAEPVKRYAGIEVGGSGVKATVIEPQAGGLYQRLFAKTRKTSLSILEGGAFRKDALRDTVEAIAGFFRTIGVTYRVPAESIVLVGSSGVPAATNRNVLIEEVKKATGATMRFIDERTEVELTIAGIVPRTEWATALSLDIGSGNTKGGYKPASGSLVFASVPLGTVTFTERVRALAKAKGGNFATAASQLREEALIAPLSRGAQAMPELERRKRVYLSGGMVWALVTLEKPEAIDRAYVTFTAADVERLHAHLSKAEGKVPKVDLKGIKDMERRKRAAREIEAVGKAYTPENLLAGAEILRALVKVFALEGKTLIFPRNAHVGWLAAYIAGVNR